MHVGGVKGLKHCTVIPIKDQKAMYVGGVKSGVCGFYTMFTVYRVMLLILLMLEVSKAYCTLYTVASRLCQEGRLFQKPSILVV